jgi:uncharacterized protein (TIGR02246 family)
MKTEERHEQFFLNYTALKSKFFLIGLGFVALLSIASLNALGADSSDEIAVRTLVMGFPAAWDHHDMKALGDIFTEDADLINVVGMHWRGRTNIVKALTAFHRAMFAKEQIHFGDISIRFITPDVAVAVATQTSSGEITWRDGRKQQVDPIDSQLDTFVVVKRDGTWKIAHNQNTIVNQKAQPDNPVNGGWNGEIGK